MKLNNRFIFGILSLVLAAVIALPLRLIRYLRKEVTLYFLAYPWFYIYCRTQSGPH